MAYLIAKERKSHGCLEVKKPAYHQVGLESLYCIIIQGSF